MNTFLLFHLIFILTFVSCTDSKFSSNYQELPLICGSKKINKKTKIIKIFDSNGESVKGEDIRLVSFDGQKLPITREGCALLPKSEGVFFAKIYSQTKKEMIEIIRS